MPERIVARIGLPADFKAVVTQLQALAKQYPKSEVRNSDDGSCYEILIVDEDPA